MFSTITKQHMNSQNLFFFDNVAYLDHIDNHHCCRSRVHCTVRGRLPWLQFVILSLHPHFVQLQPPESCWDTCSPLHQLCYLLGSVHQGSGTEIKLWHPHQCSFSFWKNSFNKTNVKKQLVDEIAVDVVANWNGTCYQIQINERMWYLRHLGHNREITLNSKVIFSRLFHYLPRGVLQE